MPKQDAMRRSARPTSRMFLCAGLPLAVLAASGCAGLDDVDRRLDRLIAERAQGLGPDAVNPHEPAQDPADPDERAFSETPPTTNPAADTLSYEPADPERDVAARLADLSEQSLGEAAERRALSLADILRLAESSAREFKTAEEDYLLAAIRLLIERHLWSPRFFNDTSAQLAGRGDGGSFDTAVDLVNTLRANQRLPFGGAVEASWIVRATEQLTDSATEDYVQSSELVLGANLPLLRGFGRVAREDRIQAERDLIYAARDFERFRRAFLVDISRDYFDLLNTRARITNQQRQLESLRRVEARTQELVDAGRESAFRTKIVSSQVLTAEANLASLRESYVLGLERFKVRLGLSPDNPIELAGLGVSLPDPFTELDAVTRAALRFRLDLQNQLDRLEDARRGVTNARNELLPDLDVNAQFRLPTDPDDNRPGVDFSGDDSSYLLGLTLSLPLDREIERLRLRQSIIGLERGKRSYERSRDNVIVEARSAARSLELARFRLRLAELDVQINESRLQEQQLKADEVDPQTIVDTENDLLDALNDRDQAVTDLRTAILEYLLATGQLRVQPDGSFRLLPGMELTPAEELEAPADAAQPEGLVEPGPEAEAADPNDGA